jgi:hypothetical protein
VRYGAEPRWSRWRKMRRREESVTCGNELFGDPYPGRGKRCQVTNKHRTQNTEHRTQNTAGGGGVRRAGAVASLGGCESTTAACVCACVCVCACACACGAQCKPPPLGASQPPRERARWVYHSKGALLVTGAGGRPWV